MPSFLHSGALGDLIYALPTIKRLGGGTVYLINREEEGLRPVDNSFLEAIAPLLRAQSYIDGVEMHKGQKITHDFTGFRAGYRPHLNLAELQANHVAAVGGLVDLAQPWIEAGEFGKHGRPVFARSGRYHSPDWQLIWHEVVRQYPNAIFLGLAEEHAAFEKDFGKTEFRPAANLLEAAKLIAGASIFIGNQSSLFALAEGLKQRVIQETHPQIRDAIFRRSGAEHITTMQQWQKRKEESSEKIMLALGIWEGDMQQGLELVKLICDIEPAKRTDVEFAVMYAQPKCEAIAQQMHALAAEKFGAAFLIKGRRNSTGWPVGPNDLWQDCMGQIEGMKCKSEAIFTFEPDCIPLRQDWINVLRSEWGRAKALGRWAVGHIQDEPLKHLNGNAVFAKGIMKKFPVLYGSRMHNTGWDIEHAKILLPVSLDSTAIAFGYRIQENFTRERVEQIRKKDAVPAVFHGIKNVSGIGAVRSMMAAGTFSGREPITTAEIDKSGGFLISILCLNRLEATKRCIEAVLRNSTQPIMLHITDNGSTDGTAEYLNSLNEPFSKHYIIFNGENRGFIEPNNQAFQFAQEHQFRYFIALNNDTEPPLGWLEKLREPLDADPNAALSGPKGGCYSLKDNFHGTMGSGSLEYIEGSCLCAKVELVSKYGPLFSSYLDFIYGDDSDLSLRMREKGHSIHQVDFVMPHARGETVLKQPEVRRRCEEAQAKNHETLRKRWAHYLRVRKFDYPIIIKREFAIGDVLLTTPIIRAIKESNPLSPIYIETRFGEIFVNNPYRAGATERLGGEVYSTAVTVDLNMAYENRPGTHIVRAYEEATREMIPGLGKVELKTELFPSEGDMQWARGIKTSPHTKLCVIHCDRTDWPGKNYSPLRIFEVAKYLAGKGYVCALVGRRDPSWKLEGTHDLRGLSSIMQLAALMKLASLFVGIDSFPLHCAQAMGCPVIGLFGCTRAEYIFTEGSKHIGVESSLDIPCSGNRHRVSGATFVGCDGKCMESISVARIIEAIDTLIA